ncbi:MAG: valyl-tRNA synthetase [Candidatus Saganbacteria bacterium]|uniref:Valine--tRNA ligase n=1 Tax=Candidatus Saganbacteria bacterium TaxID=2575572 RepID=A0A833NXH9_UNCSA|nr:MAG: valyl-tRNA synthetase [Candidatus Saganbacteria bacterium]
MTEELSKTYSPSEVEQKWYKIWEENKLFTPDKNSTAKPFVIVIPPPNVTGSLHMGHALNNAIQDLLIRYKKMNGFNTLWIPGTDHAGIATQNVVERELKKEGKRKEDLGREKFVEKIWEWKKEYGGRITNQLRRLGASCDWTRERFTMDEGLSKAVRRHFVQLYNEGLIYRGKRIINWCPRCKTALSDIEVEHETKKSSLWHIKYGSIIVATTRPETMLGDTAIAVNPKDERYKHLWGKTIELPLVGRMVPIIKDDFVDPSFGTGAVKVTPSHDPNDYEMGMRHNLPFVNIMTPDGHITLAEIEKKENISMLEGMDRFAARERIVGMLEENGFLEKIEDYETSIGHCYRCKTVIEPYLSDQWFVKVGPLAKKGIEAVEKGEIKFVPERWTKVYLQWMTNLRDWCISRQLWWGHQVPAWYCRNGMTNDKCQMSNECNEIIVSEEKPEKCPKCGGKNLVQDPDVFDTWFSSALWPFSTLGWPDNTEDLTKFYPTDVLVTSYDIITFWVARMIMAGLHFMKKAPFHTVYIHGLVKDIHGKKMSKSWGNVIDPIEVIEKAGADALRFAFISLIAGQGQDVKLSEEKITEARNFANKIWNVSRFVMMNTSPSPKPCLPAGRPMEGQGEELEDKWILSRFNQTAKDVSSAIEKYNFGEGARLLYEFVWGEFCDWYVEIAKIRIYGNDEKKKEQASRILMEVLQGSLKLLHPFMPFITEEIYRRTQAKSIMLEKWPENIKADETAISKMEYLKTLITAIRNIKAETGTQTKTLEEVILAPDDSEKKAIIEGEAIIKALAKISRITVKDELKDKPQQSAAFMANNTKGYVPLKGLIDLEKEMERINKEIDKTEQEIQKIKTLLSDNNFIARAPKEAIEKQSARQKELAEKIKLLHERSINLCGDK